MLILGQYVQKVNRTYLSLIHISKSYAKQIVKYKCNFIAGVPTLYEALLRLPSMDCLLYTSLVQ